MDKKHLDYFMEHIYKEDLPPRELVGAAAIYERNYTNTAKLLVGDDNECSCSFCNAKLTVKDYGILLWPPEKNNKSKYCPMCGRHFLTKDLDEILEETNGKEA